MNHRDVAEEIAKKICHTDDGGWWIAGAGHLDGTDAIAAILAECYGPVVEAVHEFLDESGCLDYPIPSEALGSIAGLARLVNRAIDNADGTVTITERKEE